MQGSRPYNRQQTKIQFEDIIRRAPQEITEERREKMEISLDHMQGHEDYEEFEDWKNELLMRELLHDRAKIARIIEPIAEEVEWGIRVKQALREMVDIDDYERASLAFRDVLNMLKGELGPVKAKVISSMGRMNLHARLSLFQATVVMACRYDWNMSKLNKYFEALCQRADEIGLSVIKVLEKSQG
ncbi:hypothetical protein KKD19_01340 [Patescibacteria group bacterium]|nr:hypothetical protein [Patescibacteria group bacterium]MBU4511876.1 hypothetical protein [Patescibacteria group bacterium]